MKRTLLIDDCRNLYASCIARNYHEGILCLKNNGPWDLLCLDHDLGESKTGYDVMCWLEEYPEYLPKKIQLVTSNPVGRKRMQQVIDKLYPK